MKTLVIYSDYGAKETLRLPNPTEDDISSWIDKLDWRGFHQVIVEEDDQNYMEIGGGLDPSDGLSSLYQEGGQEYVISEPPPSVEHMKALLLTYFRGIDTFKKLYN